MPRLRKAWRVWIYDRANSGIEYAETAGKARYQVFLAASDVFNDLTIMQVHVRRAADDDLALPDEHWLVPHLTEKQRSVITHAFGGTGKKAGYRDHYCTDPSNRTLLSLAWELGIFSGPHGEKAYGETSGWAGAFFYLTDFGKQVATSMLPTYPQY